MSLPGYPETVITVSPPCCHLCLRLPSSCKVHPPGRSSASLFGSGRLQTWRAPVAGAEPLLLYVHTSFCSTWGGRRWLRLRRQVLPGGAGELCGAEPGHGCSIGQWRAWRHPRSTVAQGSGWGCQLAPGLAGPRMHPTPGLHPELPGTSAEFRQCLLMSEGTQRPQRG